MNGDAVDEMMMIWFSDGSGADYYGLKTTHDLDRSRGCSRAVAASSLSFRLLAVASRKSEKSQNIARKAKQQKQRK